MRFNSPGDALQQCRNSKRKNLGSGGGTLATAFSKTFRLGVTLRVRLGVRVGVSIILIC